MLLRTQKKTQETNFWMWALKIDKFGGKREGIFMFDIDIGQRMKIRKSPKPVTPN